MYYIIVLVFHVVAAELCWRIQNGKISFKMYNRNY